MITIIKPDVLIDKFELNFRKEGMNSSQVMHLITCTGNKEDRPENNKAVDRKNNRAIAILKDFRIFDCISRQTICA